MRQQFDLETFYDFPIYNYFDFFKHKYIKQTYEVYK